jgi:hypothetical protein
MAVVAALAPACSFMVGAGGGYRVPDQAAPEPASCGHRVAPILDTVVALPLLGMTFAALGTEHGGDDNLNPDEKLSIFATLAVIDAAVIGSAAYGFTRTQTCRRAITDRERRSEASALGSQAVVAADHDDCERATTLLAQICTLDRPAHAELVRDLRLSRCAPEADALARCDRQLREACSRNAAGSQIRSARQLTWTSAGV